MGTIGDGRMAQHQGGRRADRGRWGRITLAGKDVEDDVGSLQRSLIDSDYQPIRERRSAVLGLL